MVSGEEESQFDFVETESRCGLDQSDKSSIHSGGAIFVENVCRDFPPMLQPKLLQRQPPCDKTDAMSELKRELYIMYTFFSSCSQ